MKQKRSLTGIRPTGDVHLGNYLGMIQPALALQEQFHCMYFIADMHALTSNKNGTSIREQSLSIAATFLALGFDYKSHVLYRQSDVPLVAEYAWYLSCCVGMGLLEKAHAYKDAAADGREVNHGVFAYPVLMAADILITGPDVVPVGKDQKQHVEMARDFAGSVNAIYGEGLIKLPEPLIYEKVMVIPGLDGRKMSKSYNNYIPLFAEEKALRKLIMSIKTDSTALEEPKSLKDSFVGQLFELFAGADKYQDLEKRMQQGGMGWGHAKEELFVAINEHIKEPRARYSELRKDETMLHKILDDGANRALEISRPHLDALRLAVGMERFRLK